MELRHRDYQVDAIDNVFDEWSRVRSTLVVLPCGMGKTAVAAGIIDRIDEGEKTLFLVHRDLLVRQSAKEFKSWTNKTIDIECKHQGIGKTHGGTADVIVASVQSLMGRKGKYGKDFFQKIICDEAHRFSAADNTWRGTLDYFEAKRRYGTTATPYRGSGESVMEVWDTVAYKMSMVDAVDNGWLVPMRVRMERLRGVNLDDITKRGGDYAPGELSAAMSADPVVRHIAARTIEIAAGRQCVIFCIDVAQVKAVTAEIQRRGVTAMMIVGTTPDFIRQQNDADFRAGRIQVCVNCEVAIEGWSVNQVGVVALARPTQSRTRYEQMLGRGSRPIDPPDAYETPGARRAFIAGGEKPFVTIIDFVGVSKKSEFQTGIDILGGTYSSDEREEYVRLIADMDGDFDINDIARQARENVAKRPKNVPVEELGFADRSAEKKYMFSYTPDPYAIFGLSKKSAEAIKTDDVYSPKMQKARDFLTDCKVPEKVVQQLSGHEIIFLARYIWWRSENGYASYPVSVRLWLAGFEVVGMKRGEASKLVVEMKKEGWMRPVKYGPNPHFHAYRMR